MIEKMNLRPNWLIALVPLLMWMACKEVIKSPSNKSHTSATPRPTSHELKLIDSSKAMLSEACIVLRRGNDVISDMFSQFNRTDKTFSHCGVAFNENGRWYIYHSIGGEDNPDAVLRKEPFDSFVRKECNHGFGITKVNITNLEAKEIKQVVTDFYSKKIPFDMQFDLQTDERLYCAEMIYKAFHQGLQRNDFFPTTQNGRFVFVSTDNLFVNNNVSLLCRVSY